jgi:hypothetical protein
MLHKNKITLYAFVLFLFGFILMTLTSISAQAQTNAGEKVGDELTINGSRYWTGDFTSKLINRSILPLWEKLSEVEKDVRAGFTGIEMELKRTSKIDETIDQKLNDIFRDGRTRSDEIDALQERIKMLEDRLAKKMRNTQNPDQMPMNTINSNSGYNEHGYPEEHQYDQSTNEKTQGFSSGNAYKEDTKSDCDTPDGRGKNGVIGVDC